MLTHYHAQCFEKLKFDLQTENQKTKNERCSFHATVNFSVRCSSLPYSSCYSFLGDCNMKETEKKKYLKCRKTAIVITDNKITPRMLTHYQHAQSFEQKLKFDLQMENQKTENDCCSSHSTVNSSQQFECSCSSSYSQFSSSLRD